MVKSNNISLSRKHYKKNRVNILNTRFRGIVKSPYKVFSYYNKNLPDNNVLIANHWVKNIVKPHKQANIIFWARVKSNKNNKKSLFNKLHSLHYNATSNQLCKSSKKIIREVTFRQLPSNIKNIIAKHSLRQLRVCYKKYIKRLNKKASIAKFKHYSAYNYQREKKYKKKGLRYARFKWKRTLKAKRRRWGWLVRAGKRKIKIKSRRKVSRLNYRKVNKLIYFGRHKPLFLGYAEGNWYMKCYRYHLYTKLKWQGVTMTEALETGMNKVFREDFHDEQVINYWTRHQYWVHCQKEVHPTFFDKWSSFNDKQKSLFMDRKNVKSRIGTNVKQINKHIYRSIKRKRRKIFVCYSRRSTLLILKNINPYLWFGLPRRGRRAIYLHSKKKTKISRLISRMPFKLLKKLSRAQVKVIQRKSSVHKIQKSIKFSRIIKKNSIFLERNLMRNFTNFNLIKTVYKYALQTYINCSQEQQRAILSSKSITEIANILSVSSNTWHYCTQKIKNQIKSAMLLNTQNKHLLLNRVNKQIKRPFLPQALPKYRSFSNTIRINQSKNESSKSIVCVSTELLNIFVINTVLIIKSNNSTEIKKPQLIQKINKKLNSIYNMIAKVKKSAQITKRRRRYSKLIVRNKYGWFHNKKLYQTKWFRRRFRRWYSRYRKISKNKLFAYLLRNNFTFFTGLNERTLLNFWAQFRRGSNKYWGPTNLVKKFAQTLLISPANILLLVHLAPSITAASSLVQCGNIIINGALITNKYTGLKPGDVVQINNKFFKSNKLLFTYHQWKIGHNLFPYISFLEVDLSLLLLFIIAMPHSHELLAPYFLSERWIRYYIRQFPVRTKKYAKQKNIFKTK